MQHNLPDNPSIEDLQRAVADADAAAEQKANFLATMSHEIRTPMQSVYGLLELIEHANPPPDILAMARTARRSASGLLEILDDILDFAKMDADKMELDMFEVPLRTLAHGIIEALEVKIQDRDIILQTDISENVPFVIKGDPKRLRQILMNLAGNALKFTESGNITISIRKASRGGEYPILRFAVSDTGIGMDSFTAARLFQPFTQADSSTARKFGGTGLGLSICKKLVEMMEGRIGVDSEEGKGSTFWFEIPVEEVSLDADSIQDMPDLDGISVLSVEDHPQGAKEIVRSLQSMGATVESCGTVAEGINLLRRRPFDVAIIDQGLPDGEGLDLIRQAIDLRPFMGLIMYTMRDDARLKHTLQSLGVTYLAKPASRTGLGEAVQDAASKALRVNIAGPPKLVIAEDTESVRDILRRQLDMLGVEATFVQNGREALEAVKSENYGILLTDLHMPEVDGHEVVRRIREADAKTSRHFPVIALTADVQMAQRQVYLSHGFDECLLKPVSLGQFRRLLIRWGLLGEEDNLSIPAVTEASPDNPNNDAPIDRDAIIAQMGAFDKSAVEMLGLFAEMTAPLVARIVTAQKGGDYADLTEAAHSLKGAARSACANILGNLAAQLQEEAEGQGSRCAVLAKAVQTEFERVKTAIKSLSV